MNEPDIQAWEREIDHAAKMQEQRKTITFAGGKTYEITIPFNHYEVKEDEK